MRPRAPLAMVRAPLAAVQAPLAIVRAPLAAVQAPLAAWLLLLLAALAAAAPARGDVQIRARLEPEVVALGETAVLTIEVQGDSFGRFTFRPTFELDNLEEVGGPYQSDNISIVNGDFSRTLRISWQVRPIRPGRAAVRALRVELRGQTLNLGDREIEVAAAAAGGAPGRGGYAGQEDGREPGRPEAEDQEEEEPPDPFDRFFGSSPLKRLLEPFERDREPRVFLRAEVTPEHPWVGQQVLYNVYLYTREDITAINPQAIPAFRGFWVRDIPQPQDLRTDMVEVDGERYGRVVLLSKALFPLRAGPHRIESTKMELMVRRVERTFFGPPIERPRQVDLATPAVAVDVRPLPPAPPGFSGAVGRLALKAELAPRQIAVGEAATLSVTLSGQGHLQSLPAPDIAEPPGLELLPPQQDGGDELAGSAVRGQQTWSYAVVPERPGRYRLEVPEVPYFDPALGEYRVARVAPIDLAAAPRAALAADAADGPDSPHPVRSAAFLRGLPGFRRLAPWLFGLPFGLGLALALVRARREASPAAPIERVDPTPGRGGRAGAAPAATDPARPAAATAARRRLEARLRSLEKTAGEERPRQAAAAIEEAWRDFLAARWRLPPGTPSPQWSKALGAHGADPEAAAELALLADDLHYLRYAPQLSATGPLVAEVLARGQRLLRRLR